jgi:hypothetical protein
VIRWDWWTLSEAMVTPLWQHHEVPYCHAADPASLYDTLRHSFVRLVGGLPSDQRVIPVPATPDWTVADVLARVVGITADLNCGRLDRG